MTVDVQDRTGHSSKQYREFIVNQQDMIQDPLIIVHRQHLEAAHMSNSANFSSRSISDLHLPITTKLNLFHIIPWTRWEAVTSDFKCWLHKIFYRWRRRKMKKRAATEATIPWQLSFWMLCLRQNEHYTDWNKQTTKKLQGTASSPLTLSCNTGYRKWMNRSKNIISSQILYSRTDFYEQTSFVSMQTGTLRIGEVCCMT